MSLTPGSTDQPFFVDPHLFCFTPWSFPPFSSVEADKEFDVRKGMCLTEIDMNGTQVRVR